MNKIMSRYKGLILSCVSVLMIVVCVCSFSIESRAGDIDYGMEFFVNYSEPATSDYEGYITLLLYNELNNKYEVETYFWYTCAVTDSLESPAYMCVMFGDDENGDGYVEFAPGAISTVDKGYYSLGCINTEGVYRYQKYSSTTRHRETLEASYNKRIVACKYAGNIGMLSGQEYLDNVDEPFSVYYSEDGSARLLMSILQQLQGIANDSEVQDLLTDINNTVVTELDDIESLLTTIASRVGLINSKMDKVKDVLDNIYEEISIRFCEISEQFEENNSWLERIWNSIQEFFNPSNEEKEESEKFEQETTEKSDTLDSLNEQNKTDKTDIDSASSSVDENVDLDSIDNYGNVLVVITENEYILQVLLLVFSVALVGYVLFGKR